MPNQDHKSAPARLASIDAYRGLVMFLMMAEVVRLRSLAEAFPSSKILAILAHHQDHVEWLGCTLHDMIQPSFSFLVGVSLPFSIASRLARGQSKSLLAAHAFWRAFILVALGVFLRSVGQSQTNYTFEDTLSQIGLGYGFLFLLGLRRVRDQIIALVVILLGYWAAFVFYSPGAGFDPTQFGVPSDWPPLQSLSSHFDKNSNLAWAFDRWFLNLFPRKTPFEFNGGGYATLSFIPTLATMILGLLAGETLKSDSPNWKKMNFFLTAGFASLALGWALEALGICPVVKRIWTPAWVLYSGGICFFFLAAFYSIIDVLRLKRWAFPLIVIGMNSIAAYCLSHLIEGFIVSSLKTHLGPEIFQHFGAPYAPFLQGASVLLILWLILLWMYRRKIFLRI